MQKTGQNPNEAEALHSTDGDANPSSATIQGVVVDPRRADFLAAEQLPDGLDASPRSVQY